MSENMLDWYEEFDLDGNSIWSARSCYEEGMEYRVRPRLRLNKVEWVEDSDMELVCDIEDPKIWDSLQDAKSEIQKWHDEAIQEAKEHFKNHPEERHGMYGDVLEGLDEP